MKDYERYIYWLDYFNSELKRSEGRRVPLSGATRSPSLDELGEASRRLNLQPEAVAATYPPAPERQSGYVSVRKAKGKHVLLLDLAKELAVVRGIAQKKQPQKPSSRKK